MWKVNIWVREWKYMCMKGECMCEKGEYMFAQEWKYMYVKGECMYMKWEYMCARVKICVCKIRI